LIERIDMQSKYSAIEASIHLARYLLAKEFVVGKRVLDMACGEGYGSYLMKQWGAESVVGIDIDAETIEKAKELFQAENLEYYTSNAENVDFLDEKSFDIVVSFETLEHVDEPEKYLHEIKRVVKDDGVVIISCPNDHYYYPTEAITNPYHKRKYTFDEFVDLTQGILGDVSSQSISGAVVGFMNCEIQTANKIAENQMDMIQSIQSIQSIQVSPNVALDIKNACYWVLLWDFGNAGKKLYDSTVSYVTDLKTAGQPLLDSVSLEKKLWESFEEQAALGKIIKQEQAVSVALANELDLLQQNAKDMEVKYTALNNELEFLKQSKNGKHKKQKKKLSTILRNKYSSLRSEKLKRFIYRFYSKLPYKIKAMIRKR